MDLQRLILFVIFSFSLLMVWDGWQRFQHPDNQQSTTAGTGTSKPQIAQPDGSGLATPGGANSFSELPALVTSPGQPALVQQSTQQTTGKTIHVKTDFLEAEISTIGGDIVRLALLKHPDWHDKNKSLVLFQRGEGTHNYIAQTGLLGSGLPNHNTPFVPEKDEYGLSGDAEKVQVRLKAVGESKLKVTKVITFHKGSYLVDVGYELENTGPQPVTGSSYYQLVRDSVAPAGGSLFCPLLPVRQFTQKKKSSRKSLFPT